MSISGLQNVSWYWARPWRAPTRMSCDGAHEDVDALHAGQLAAQAVDDALRS